MTLHAPDLDDRRFQDLVDEAKRYVQRRCPEWTDHNVSDPGVTLIETFAQMVDQLVFRLNQVPDRLYVSFLELLGLRLQAPTAARAEVTLRLSAPQAEAVPVPARTRVATTRADGEEPVVFETVDALDIVPCELARIASGGADGRGVQDHTDRFALEGFSCFQSEPRPGDVLLIGLDVSVPSLLVGLRFDCSIEGIGVDPDDPPLVWEAWGGGSWVACELERDTTGGLNRPGDVELHVPAGHTLSVVGGERSGWVRCRVVEAGPTQPPYSTSPMIHGLTAVTLGGTTAAVNAERIDEETLGLSEGVPGQRFSLEHPPVVADGPPPLLEVAGGHDQGWEPWTQVHSFADSGPDDRHFMLDPVAGEVVFGPAVREPDGSLRQFGAVPDKGALLRLRTYLTGGGRRGNVDRDCITVLKSSIPYIASVTNRRPAAGGVDAERLEDARRRAPILIRTRNRAVTVADYEALAREAAPEVIRVRGVRAGEGVDAGGVRILVVPAAVDREGLLEFAQLVPADETLERIAGYLDERRTVGARVVVEPPLYQGIRVDARVQLRRGASGDRVSREAAGALYRYFHPLSGGPDGDGWPFGRPVHVGEVHAVLQRIDGVDFVADALLRPADPVSGDLGDAVERIELDRHALVFSSEHHVRIGS